jgi:rod shape-determining protein MreD
MMMAALDPHEMVLPIKPAFIVFSFIAAALLNMLPASDWAMWGRPDFVALLVLYWCIEQPERIGFGAAFVLGLLMDVADGAFFGQHALAYSILAYAAIELHRRVRMFEAVSQVIYVIPLLLVNDLIVLAIRMLAGADFPGYRYFLGSLVAGAFWPVISVLLKLPQRPASDSGRS